MWMFVCVLCGAFISAEADDVTFDLVLRHFWDFRMQYSPEFSTYQGVYKYNDATQSMNLSVIERKKEAVESFLSMVELINKDELSKAKQMEYVIFKDYITTFLDGYKWATYVLSPVNFLEGIHLYFPVEKAETNTRGDFENYIVRMFNMPKLVDEVISRMNEAIRLNLTYHKVSIAAVPDQIQELLVGVDESNFYIPFNKSLEKSLIPEKVRLSLRRRGREGIAGVLDSYRRLKDYIENTYLHHTRPQTSVKSLRNGVDYYRACLKWHTSLDVSPEYVHNLGLQEVNRIYGNMQKVLNRFSFMGSVKDFFDSIKNDARFIIDDADEIVEEYTDLVNNRIRPILPKYFTNIPNVMMTVEKSPNDGTGGSYALASEVNPGKFLINLYRPRENPTFDYMALSLHEAYPGHHMQHSYTMKADLAKYRRFPEYSFYDVPFTLPFFSAYVEGWGLYSEYLGEEMGLYADDYELMGRYSGEMMRASRLVIDTGIHHFDWTKEKAMDYMFNYTAYGPGFVEIEINRYITWPGQACAYKMGEIKIRELRRKSEKELGEMFDIKKFHSVILEHGPMSMNILETLVDGWIEETKAAHNGATAVSWSTETQLPLFLVLISAVTYCVRVDH
ncbi:uncharacterized protein LOC110454710 isoform X1 [Mizuhopecten yessoensis]|uniref:DUF885 domain-containing protein n=2 Tax=Mizuhopecten yessoensis TaxID=6573 RepID=A0A210QEZ3_MIZYE|nr:uncharacterized protein LOC110454710 isoform X1 [Mizuhopecten yessoensis]OWF47191.1 hypothetical protein KP79_PYT20388 [Mizuhopecten yessoensis]